MHVDILILAAGASSRMQGEDKLTQDIGGEPLLRRMARMALATGQPVTIALPPDRPARRTALQGLPVQSVTVPHPEQGIAESLKAALATLPPGRGLLLLLADLPDLTTADLTHLLTLWAQEPQAILRAAAEDGTPGHPVCFPPDLRDDLMTLKGDEGARSILIRHRARLQLVPLPGRHATTDLDTPEDWAAWRSGTAPGSA